MKNIYKKLQFVLFLYLLTKFQSNSQRETYGDFPQITCLKCNSRVYKKTSFLRSYLRNIAQKALNFRPEVQWDFVSNGFYFFFTSETSQKKKKIIAKMPWWPIWSNETLESKALISIVMKLVQKKIEKIDERLRNKPLQGGNLLYISQMNNSWMIQMTKPHFYI